jgi:oligoribonuclease NrnB/cAMP/cGMP phosphodiesterase (DHH superfamily)
MKDIIPNMKDFHLYTHAGCMDGSASAILFRHAGGKKENIHWVAAGRSEDEMKKSAAINDPNIPILMVDISPGSVDFARYLVARGNVWIIDHHVTATYLNGMHPNFFVDEKNEACGCENFRRWLVKNGIVPAPEFMEHDTPKYTFDSEHYKKLTMYIDDHDRWQHKHPWSMEVAKFFAFVGQKDFVERFMNLDDRFDHINRTEYWTPFEKDLMKLLTRIQESKYRSAFEKMQIKQRVMLGKPVTAAYIISDEVNNSEMLNLYLNEHPDVDVAIQISFGLQKVSMRSNDRIDVAAICQKYGGGGHKNAAGHPLPKGMINEIVGGMHV